MKYPDSTRKELLKKIYWDYTIDTDSLLIQLDNNTLPQQTKERLFIRCLQHLPWHFVVGIFGFDKAKELLTNEVTQKIWPKERSTRFAILRKILYGEPLPPARWDTELRKKIRSTVLSNRWYRTQ